MLECDEQEAKNERSTMITCCFFSDSVVTQNCSSAFSEGWKGNYEVKNVIYQIIFIFRDVHAQNVSVFRFAWFEALQ